MKQILGNKFVNRLGRGWKDGIETAFMLATASARKRKLDNYKYLFVH